MKRPIACLLFGFFLLGVSASQAQIVMRVIPGYVLIDTDTGIGGLNEVVKVYRLRSEGVVLVGWVKLLRFRDSKTGAQIVSEEPGYRIGVGDFLGERKTGTRGISAASPERSVRAFRQSLPRWRGTARVGVHLGRFVPASNLEDVFENSHSLGLSQVSDRRKAYLHS